MQTLEDEDSLGLALQLRFIQVSYVIYFIFGTLLSPVGPFYSSSEVLSPVCIHQSCKCQVFVQYKHYSTVHLQEMQGSDRDQHIEKRQA